MEKFVFMETFNIVNPYECYRRRIKLCFPPQASRCVAERRQFLTSGLVKI
ncbi:MAG TPA: hypothetical protein PLY87_29670 [Planctomycetaceae bacterium]|nr:hypothetical protein [Planctomycetaceae bacterium]